MFAQNVIGTHCLAFAVLPAMKIRQFVIIVTICHVIRSSWASVGGFVIAVDVTRLVRWRIDWTQKDKASKLG